jgi:hypothetical protein
VPEIAAWSATEIKDRIRRVAGGRLLRRCAPRNDDPLFQHVIASGERSNPRPSLDAPVARNGLMCPGRQVQAVAQLLAGLEERDVLLRDLDAVAGARVAPDPGVPALY